MKDFLFSFEGRVRRRDWWLFYVVVGVINYAIIQSAPLFLGEEGRVQVEPGTFAVTYPLPLTILTFMLSLVWIWPYLALTAKRAHDRDKSARLVLILLAICYPLGYLPMILPMVLGPDQLWLAFASMFLTFPIGIYLLVVQGFLDGTPGPNRYGPSPKGLGGPEAEFS